MRIPAPDLDTTSIDVRCTARSPAPRVAVFGDGLGGLATAYYLLRAGRTPLVVPAPEPGRELLRSRMYGGTRIDAFHRPIRADDSATLGLLHDLGLTARLSWRDVTPRAWRSSML